MLQVIAIENIPMKSSQHGQIQQNYPVRNTDFHKFQNQRPSYYLKLTSILVWQNQTWLVQIFSVVMATYLFQKSWYLWILLFNLLLVFQNPSKILLGYRNPVLNLVQDFLQFLCFCFMGWPRLELCLVETNTINPLNTDRKTSE